MSGGPIDQARRGHLASPASTNPRTAVHGYGGPMRAYCGRRGGVSGALISTWDQVTCADCHAAYATDAAHPAGGAR